MEMFSTEPVHDLSQSVSGAMTNTKIVKLNLNLKRHHIYHIVLSTSFGKSFFFFFLSGDLHRRN